MHEISCLHLNRGGVQEQAIRRLVHLGVSSLDRVKRSFRAQRLPECQMQS